MKNDFIIAITQLSAEKNLPKEVVLEAVEAALASAFKKELANIGSNITVKVNPTSGELTVHTHKVVVEEVTDSKAEMTVDEARAVDPKAVIGDTISMETTPQNAGRIAAQTAKQVVMQRLREAEREIVFAEFAGREGDIVSGVISRMEPKQIVIDLGKTEAVLPATEQVRSEHYRIGQRVKAYVLEVFRASRGPQVMVSRTHRNLVRRLFELEVPEIFNGTVEIKAIAREPGARSKVAVAARQEGVDAVGSCIGLRGIRIQNIMNELSGEKIDVIEWHPDAAQFVANALSPAPVISAAIDEEAKTATVVVPDRQLSLAIGREGQNARLAAKLTGWRIDIKSATVAEAERAARAAEAVRQSVVRIRGYAVDPSEPEAGLKERGTGTGVVIMEDGTLLTNLHVVAGAEELRVTFFDGTETTAKIAGAQPDNDLAVLKPKEIPDDLPPATLGASNRLAPGDEVVAVGFPFGIGPPAAPIVSELHAGSAASAAIAFPFSCAWTTPSMHATAVAATNVLNLIEDSSGYSRCLLVKRLQRRDVVHRQSGRVGAADIIRRFQLRAIAPEVPRTVVGIAEEVHDVGEVRRVLEADRMASLQIDPEEVKLQRLELPPEEEEKESRERALGLVDLGAEGQRRGGDRDMDREEDFGDDDGDRGAEGKKESADEEDEEDE